MKFGSSNIRRKFWYGRKRTMGRRRLKLVKDIRNTTMIGMTLIMMNREMTGITMVHRKPIWLHVRRLPTPMAKRRARFLMAPSPIVGKRQAAPDQIDPAAACLP